MNSGKRQNSDNKRTRSISRKINRRLLRKLLSSFILMDIIIVVMAVFFWCHSAETGNGDKFSISNQRSFSSVTSLEPDEKNGSSDVSDAQDIHEAYADYLKAKDNNISSVFPGKFRDTLAESMYSYEDDSGKMRHVYSGTFLLSLFSCVYITAIIQLLTIAGVLISGARKIRRYLAPLDELAFKAQFLSDAARFDQQSLQELEDAIDAISPSGDGARIHTGNSEMENLETSINHLLERMRESYSQQSRFVSDASHELRTPISVLQGYVDMLDRWGKDDEKILDESIDAIKSETEHMKKLVEQLLFLARSDSGRTKLTMEEFSLNDMMKEVCDESSMIDEKHKYIFKPWNDDIRVTGDMAMLKQTARILAENAARYTPEEGAITMSTSMEISEDEAARPAFTIQDEGIGISSEALSHIFDRFYRSDPARAKESGGTGLGLSIAKWIVDRHGGHFKVLTMEEVGTRITVVL